MKTALLLGNAPSVATTDFSAVPPWVTTVGVNRLWHRSDTSRQWIRPQIYCALDSTIEDEWIPEVGECELFLTLNRPPYQGRPDAVTRAWRTYSDRLKWPTPSDPFLRLPSSPGFCLQWLIEEGYEQIGILGVEYSTRALCEAGKPTHAHAPNGEHVKYARKAATLDTHRGLARRFWARALHKCVDRGIRAHNLTPHKTPFHEIGFPCLPGGLVAWVRQLKQAEAAA